MPLIRPTNLLLTFDAFGTLFSPKFPIAIQYALAAQEHGLVGVKVADIPAAFKKGNYISHSLFAYYRQSGLVAYAPFVYGGVGGANTSRGKTAESDSESKPKVTFR